MKNIIIPLALLTLSFSTFAQIGVNTTVPDPSAALDVESTTLGFLPPRMTETEMSNINTPAEGLIVYCTDCDPKGLNFFDGSDWKAIGGSEAAPSVSADCDNNGFVGSYVSGEGLSGGSFSVNITNNSFSTAEISFGASDLVLSGVSGLSVGTPTPSAATLSAGQSQIITYPLSGTPASTGTLTANWSKLSLSCVKEKVVSNGDASFSLPLDKYIVSLDITSPNPVQIQGAIDNSTNTLSIDVPYTNGTGSYDAYTSNWFSVSGEGGDSNNIRYSYPSGTFSNNGVINITFEVDGDTSFLVEKQSPGIVALINSLDFTVNGDTKGAVNLNAVGGILDTNFMALQNGASFGNGANSPSDIVPQSDYGHTPYLGGNFGSITQSYRAGGVFYYDDGTSKTRSTKDYRNATTWHPSNQSHPNGAYIVVDFGQERVFNTIFAHQTTADGRFTAIEVAIADSALHGADAGWNVVKPFVPDEVGCSSDPQGYQITFPIQVSRYVRYRFVNSGTCTRTFIEVFGIGTFLHFD